MRGGAPSHYFSSYQKKRIDDERPHRSRFIVNSYHLLPGRLPLARPLSALSGRPLSTLPCRAKPVRYAVIAA